MSGLVKQGYSEKCESKVANLLASLDNLPENYWTERLDVLLECIAELQSEIEQLQKESQK